MNDQQNRHIDTLIQRIPRLLGCRQDINDAYVLLKKAYSNNRKLLVCGNGGSASDSEHIVGELMKGFLLPRKLDKKLEERFRQVCPDSADYFMENLQGALPALSMVNQVALNTAFANDQAPDLAFAQQLLGMGDAGDVLHLIHYNGVGDEGLFQPNHLGDAVGNQTAEVAGVNAVIAFQ